MDDKQDCGDVPTKKLHKTVGKKQINIWQTIKLAVININVSFTCCTKYTVLIWGHVISFAIYMYIQ